MRRILFLMLFLLVAFDGNANAADARIKKVLPQFIDSHGRTSLSPSLYERDAYQFLLRNKPEQRAGIRFKVQWKGTSESNLLLRVQIRGVLEENVHAETLEVPVKKSGWFSTWTALTLSDEAYKDFGE